VRPFIEQQGISYPILLDPGRKVNESFQIEGIPKTFIYDREGKIIAQSIECGRRSSFWKCWRRQDCSSPATPTPLRR